MPVFLVVAMQRFDFKNIIITTMILNMYWTSEWSQNQSDFEGAVLIFNLSDEGFRKSDSN